MFSTKFLNRDAKELKMFTYLKFKMNNSIGTPVSVNLYNNDGLIDYEILFPDLGVRESRRIRMSRADSSKLLKKLKNSGFVMFMERFARSGAEENEGNYWTLEIELPDLMVIRLQGPRPEESFLYPFIQDFSELLDNQFSITQYIRSDRVDKLEIEFIFNELDQEIRDMVPDLARSDHTETVTLDRSNFTFSYSKRFPSSCFHSSYECKCEQQVRQILDQTSDALTDPKLFEDVVDHSEMRPILFFNYTFHDGSTACVRRSLSFDGLRDALYIEMLEVLFETSLQLVFKDGIFDRRFMFPVNESINFPFFIVYSEEEYDT